MSATIGKPSSVGRQKKRGSSCDNESSGKRKKTPLKKERINYKMLFSATTFNDEGELPPLWYRRSGFLEEYPPLPGSRSPTIIDISIGDAVLQKRYPPFLQSVLEKMKKCDDEWEAKNYSAFQHSSSIPSRRSFWDHPCGIIDEETKKEITFKEALLSEQIPLKEEAFFLAEYNKRFSL